MKIAITSTGENENVSVDPRFGRAKYFIVYDTESKEFKALENSQNLNLPQGAGIQSAKKVADENVEAVITGNCGPKAFRTLQAAGIKVYIGADGFVKDVIKNFENGVYKEATTHNREGHQ